MNSISLGALTDDWRGPLCTGPLLPVFDKASGVSLGNVSAALPADVNSAAAVAKEAQRSWAEVPGPLRGDVIRRLAQLVLDHRDEIAAQIVRETGSIRGKALWEVHMTSREMLEAAALGSQPLGVVNASAEVGRHSVARRIPIGTVGIITPWNSPFLLGARAIGPALVAGNAVLLKPDPQTPICGGVVFARLLQQAGLPEGLFQLLPGGVDVGEAMSDAHEVEMISFTGSTRAGRAVSARAGSLLKRVSLELGGNNPYIVLADADIELAASAGAWGSFFHQGQICLTAGRHLVHESVAEAYVQSLVRRAEKLKVGDPFKDDVQLGPLVNERQAVNVDRVVAQSIAAGARLRTGGSRDGLFYSPTVLTEVTRGMPAFDEEIFGPVAAVTVFSSDEEAVTMANDTPYGLSAAVMGRDLARAEAVANKLRTGIVHINDQTVLHEVYGPIGGVGISGNGHNHSTLTNLDQFTDWQWMTIRTVPPEYPF